MFTLRIKYHHTIHEHTFFQHPWLWTWIKFSEIREKDHLSCMKKKNYIYDLLNLMLPTQLFERRDDENSKIFTCLLKHTKSSKCTFNAYNLTFSRCRIPARSRLHFVYVLMRCKMKTRTSIHASGKAFLQVACASLFSGFYPAQEHHTRSNRITF